MNPPEMGWLIARSKGTTARARSVVVLQRDTLRGRIKCTFTDSGHTEWYSTGSFYSSEAAACRQLVRTLDAKITLLNKQLIAAVAARDDASRRC